MDTFLMGLE